jgi:hypothetical protein
MATYITVEQQQAQSLLIRNRQETLRNREQLNAEQAKSQALPAAAAPLVVGRRQELSPLDELTAFRRRDLNADFYVVNYGFTTGLDLDTRTSILNPQTGQFDGLVGWCKDSEIPGTDGNLVTWGGDNTGTGVEAVLFDKNVYRRTFPDSNTAVLRLRAFWYNEQGTSVTINIKGYLGGLMEAGDYTWSNDTAKRTWDKYPTFTTVAVTTNISSCVGGDFISYLKISLNKAKIEYVQTL